MRLNARAAILVATALGVTALTWWWLQRGPVSAPPSREATAPPRLDADAAAAPIVDEPPHDTATPVALPPRDTPLDRLWSTLQAPAQAGDSGAACRLAIETVRCINRERMAVTGSPFPGNEAGELRTLLAFEGNPSAFGRPAVAQDPQIQAAPDGSSERASASSRQCDGLSQDRVDRALALLRAAALAGEPDAQAAYAAGEGWFLLLPGGMSRPEFEQWRREAPLVVARMLDEGHPEAPGLLAGAYSGQTWLGGLYQHDPERAATFLILNLRLIGIPERADRLLTDLDPESRVRARQQAEALYAKQYEDRSTRKASFYLGAGTRILQSGLFEGEATPIPCSPPPAVDSPVPQR